MCASGPVSATTLLRTSAGQPVLELRAVTAGYGDLAAIRDVSLAICPGEVVALFGPNGAGKTTTLMAAVGQLPRSNGQVLWRGEESPSALTSARSPRPLLRPRGAINHFQLVRAG